MRPNTVLLLASSLLLAPLPAAAGAHAERAGYAYVGADLGLGIAPDNAFGAYGGYRATDWLAAELGVGLSGARVRAMGSSYSLTAKLGPRSIYGLAAGTFHTGRGFRRVAYAKTYQSLPSDADVSGVDHCNSAACDSDKVTAERETTWSVLYGMIGVGTEWQLQHTHMFFEAGLSRAVAGSVHVRRKLPGDAALGDVEGIVVDESAYLGLQVAGPRDAGAFVRLGLALPLTR